MLGLAALALMGYVTIRKTMPDGSTTSKLAQTCQDLGPGVNYCSNMGTKNEDVVLDVIVTQMPASCQRRVEAKSQVLMQYSGRASTSPLDDASWHHFVDVKDFTHARAVRMGVGEVVKGWDLAMEGMCAGTVATLVVPPSLGFDHRSGRPQRPTDVPAGATLRYDLEIIVVLEVDEKGVPYRPCFFRLIDRDGNGYLDMPELTRHFARIGKEVPAHVMVEDKNKDVRLRGRRDERAP